MPRSSSPFELLILDCDGVVVDSEPITTRVLAEMLNEMGIAISVEEVVATFSGHTLTLEFVSERLGASLPRQFLQDYRDRSFAAIEAELKPVPGIETALDRIGIPYCIASNGPHEKMRKTLGVTALLSRFEGRLFSAADVARSKPFPDLFLFAARHFSVPPSGCLVVEDSESGVAAARAAGMTVYGYAASTAAQGLLNAGAHRVFSQMTELPLLVDAPKRRRNFPTPKLKI